MWLQCSIIVECLNVCGCTIDDQKVRDAIDAAFIATREQVGHVERFFPLHRTSSENATRELVEKAVIMRGAEHSRGLCIPRSS